MRKLITEYLVDDHARLHRLLARAGDSEAVEVEPFSSFRRGLLRHIAIEEKVLFPSVRAALGAPLAWGHELRVEHAALTSLLVPTPDASLIRELRAFLVAHDAREEGPRGVYAECRRILGDERCIELGARAASFPEIRVAPYFDGPGVYRTSATALAAAQRIKRARTSTAGD